MSKKDNSKKNTNSLLDLLKLKSKREADLFFSLCENGQNFVESNKLKDALDQMILDFKTFLKDLTLMVIKLFLRILLAL